MMVHILTRAPFSGEDFPSDFFIDLEDLGMTNLSVYIHPISKARFIILSCDIADIEDITAINEILHEKSLKPLYKFHPDDFSDTNVFPFI